MTGLEQKHRLLIVRRTRRDPSSQAPMNSHSVVLLSLTPDLFGLVPG